MKHEYVASDDRCPWCGLFVGPHHAVIVVNGRERKFHDNYLRDCLTQHFKSEHRKAILKGMSESTPSENKGG